MTLGTGIAIAGIWLGVGIASRARDISGFGITICCGFAMVATMVVGVHP